MNVIRQYNRVKFDNTLLHPRSMSWDVTNRCNLRCQHCFNASGDSRCHDFSSELSSDEALALAEQIVELKPEQCCICGGEPLLHPNLFEIIDILVKGGIMVNMVSNGLLLTEDVAKKMKEVNITSVQISVDGLGYQHDIFRNMKGSFDKAINALKILIRNDIKSLTSFCPNTINYKSYPEYVSYISSIGCKTIRSMPLLPLGRGMENFSYLYLDSKKTFEFVELVNHMREKYPDMELEWGDPLEHLYLVLLRKRKYPIVMGIKSNGDLTVTPYLPIKVGNIKTKTLKEYWMNGYNEIWDNKEILNRIREIKTVVDFSNAEDLQYDVCI